MEDNYVRFRVSPLERFCYKRFLRNSSGTKFFVRLREVSALEDVRFREVPLYTFYLYKEHFYKQRQAEIGKNQANGKQHSEAEPYYLKIFHILHPCYQPKIIGRIQKIS